jgi:CheY-like chemotaxis protein
MPHGQHHPKQLGTLLKILQSRRASGTLHVDVAIAGRFPARSRVFVWCNGAITYGGTAIPDRCSFARKLVKRFKPSMSEIAIKFAKEKATHPDSAQEILEILCKTRILTWDRIESFAREQTAIALEQILPYGGQFQFHPAIEFDLTYGETRRGLNWSRLKFDLARRSQEWSYLTPIIASMDAIPYLPKKGLERIPLTTVRQHLQQWVNGKRTIVDIAEKIDRDPLALARFYLTWAQIGWVDFAGNSTRNDNNLPTILSVEDSSFIQNNIVKILGDRYNILLASNATDGLNLLLLDRAPISLLLLDLNLPDINGLELCRTIRNLPKFRDLPIVILTAQTSLVDKMKGIIAGTNRYLTKPFNAQTLLQIIGELV